MTGIGFGGGSGPAQAKGGTALGGGEVEISFAQAMSIAMEHAESARALNGFEEVTPGMLVTCFNDVTRCRLGDVLDVKAAQRPRFKVPVSFLECLK